MVKRLIFLILILQLLNGCKNNAVQTNHADTYKDSLRYANVVISLLQNSLDYEEYYVNLNARGRSDTNIVSNVFFINHHRDAHDVAEKYYPYKEIHDNSLGILLRAHHFASRYGYHTILYISNNKNFEYFFTLKDEERPEPNRVTYQTPAVPTRQNFQVTAFQMQLNYLAEKLLINTPTSRNKLIHFISLIEDSLLYQKRITLEDTNKIRQNEKQFNSDFSKDKRCIYCIKDIDTACNTMVNNLISKNEDFLYFGYPYSRSFWEFKIEQYDNIDIYGINHGPGKLFVGANYYKFECWPPIRY